MKRLKAIAIYFSIIVTLGVPAIASAADENTDRWMSPYLEFHLTGGKAGERVTSLSSGTVKREFSTLDEYDDACGDYAVTVSGSMGGQEESAFYWSQQPYRNQQGKSEQIAVLSADAEHPWSGESCMIFQFADIGCYIEGIEVEMGASADGPRDFKISYSTDLGKTWNAFTSFGTDKGSVLAAGSTGTVFKKNAKDIKRTYKTCSVSAGFVDGDWDVKVYDDIYFKVSVNSDYKADGTAGLYGSTAGEWGIRSVKMLGGTADVYDPPGTPGYLEAHKISEKTAVLTWMRTSGEGYEIYLKKGNGSYRKIGTVASDVTKYKLKNLSPKAIYKLRMRAYCDWNGETRYGHYSKAVTLNMKKQPLPKNLSIKKSFSIKVGKKKRLAVTCTGGTSKSYIKKVTYQVKNPKIASVNSSGMVRGKRKGNTVVTVNVVLKSGLKKTWKSRVKVVS